MPPSVAGGPDQFISSSAFVPGGSASEAGSKSSPVCLPQCPSCGAHPDSYTRLISRVGGVLMPSMRCTHCSTDVYNAGVMTDDESAAFVATVTDYLAAGASEAHPNNALIGNFKIRSTNRYTSKASVAKNKATWSRKCGCSISGCPAQIKVKYEGASDLSTSGLTDAHAISVALKGNHTHGVNTEKRAKGLAVADVAAKLASGMSAVLVFRSQAALHMDPVVGGVSPPVVGLKSIQNRSFNMKSEADADLEPNEIKRILAQRCVGPGVGVRDFVFMNDSRSCVQVLVGSRSTAFAKLFDALPGCGGECGRACRGYCQYAANRYFAAASCAQRGQRARCRAGCEKAQEGRHPQSGEGPGESAPQAEQGRCSLCGEWVPHTFQKVFIY